MKKIMLTLLVLALALPAMADVTITAEDAGDGSVNIIINAGAGVRGVALDVTLSDGTTADSTGVSYDTTFNCLPDYANTATNYTLGMVGSHPLALAGNNPGPLTAAAPNFAVCMGYLDEDGNATKGEALGVLVDVILVNIPLDLTVDTTVTITADTARGGIVGDALGTVVADATTTVTFADPICVPAADEADFLAVGSPASWCEARQCYGDADGLHEPWGRGEVAVGMDDVNVLLAGFRQAVIDPAWIGADFNRREEAWGRGFVRVGMDDVDVLLVNFRQIDADVPADCNN